MTQREEPAREVELNGFRYTLSSETERMRRALKECETQVQLFLSGLVPAQFGHLCTTHDRAELSNLTQGIRAALTPESALAEPQPLTQPERDRRRFTVVVELERLLSHLKPEYVDEIRDELLKMPALSLRSGAPEPLLKPANAPLPEGCYCKPGRCMAPVVMGRQMPCRDPKKAAASPEPDAGSGKPGAQPAESTAHDMRESAGDFPHAREILSTICNERRNSDIRADDREFLRRIDDYFRKMLGAVECANATARRRGVERDELRAALDRILKILPAINHDFWEAVDEARRVTKGGRS